MADKTEPNEGWRFDLTELEGTITMQGRSMRVRIRGKHVLVVGWTDPEEYIINDNPRISIWGQSKPVVSIEVETPPPGQNIFAPILRPQSPACDDQGVCNRPEGHGGRHTDGKTSWGIGDGHP